MKKLIFAIKRGFSEFIFVMKNYEALQEEYENQLKEQWDDYWASRF